MLQLPDSLVLALLQVVAEQVDVLARLVVQRVVERVRRVHQGVLYVERLQFVAVVRCVILHRIPKRRPKDVLTAPRILGHPKVMKRVELLDLQLVVVRKRNRRPIARLNLAVGRIAMVIDVIEQVAHFVEAISLGGLQIIIHRIRHSHLAPLLSDTLIIAESITRNPLISLDHIAHILTNRALLVEYLAPKLRVVRVSHLPVVLECHRFKFQLFN